MAVRVTVVLAALAALAVAERGGGSRRQVVSACLGATALLRGRAHLLSASRRCSHAEEATFVRGLNQPLSSGVRIRQPQPFPSDFGATSVDQEQPTPPAQTHKFYLIGPPPSSGAKLHHKFYPLVQLAHRGAPPIRSSHSQASHVLHSKYPSFLVPSRGVSKADTLKQFASAGFDGSLPTVQQHSHSPAQHQTSFRVPASGSSAGSLHQFLTGNQEPIYHVPHHGFQDTQYYREDERQRKMEDPATVDGDWGPEHGYITAHYDSSHLGDEENQHYMTEFARGPPLEDAPVYRQKRGMTLLQPPRLALPPLAPLPPTAGNTSRDATTALRDRLANLTCVLQAMGFVTEELAPNPAAINQTLLELPIPDPLFRALSDGLHACQERQRCGGSEGRSTLGGEALNSTLADTLSFLRCFGQQKLKACVSADLSSVGRLISPNAPPSADPPSGERYLVSDFGAALDDVEDLLNGVPSELVELVLL